MKLNKKQLAKIFKITHFFVNKEMETKFSVNFTNVLSAKNIEKLRNGFQSEGYAKPSYTSIILKAISRAIKETPSANRKVFSNLLGSKYQHEFEDVHAAIGTEVELEGADMFAFFNVLKNTDELSLLETNKHLKEMATQSKNISCENNDYLKYVLKFPLFLSKFVLSMPGRFPSLWKQHRGGSFSISSPAKYGIQNISGVWSYPLGFTFGLVEDKVFAKKEKVYSEKGFSFSMNFDRRILAGAPAAKFFKKITSYLEDPEWMAIDDMSDKISELKKPTDSILQAS